MFCSKCGYQNADGVVYCQRCGTKLNNLPQNTNSADNSQNMQGTSNVQGSPNMQGTPNMQGNSNMQGFPNMQNTYQQPFQPSGPAQAPRGPVIRSSHPVLNVLKNIGASPLFMVAIIAYSVYVLFNFISSVSGSAGMFSSLASLMDAFDMPYYYYSDIFGMIQGTAIGFSIIGMIPPILMAVGMWMTFASAINKQNGGMKTAGLTIIKVISIINLVFTCLLFVLLEIVMLIATIGVAGNSYTSGATGVLVVVMLVIAVGFALGIFYEVKVITTINTIKGSIITGTASDRVSGFVAVMCFIIGAFTVISIFSAGGVMAVLASLASATAYITFGILLFSYKNKMRAVMGMGADTQFQTQQSANYQQQNAWQQNTYQQQDAYAQQNAYQDPNAYTQNTYQDPNTYAQSGYQDPNAYAQNTYQDSNGYAQQDEYQDPNGYAQQDTYQDPNAQYYNTDETVVLSRDQFNHPQE